MKPLSASFRFLTASLTLVFATAAAHAEVEIYKIDPVHSGVSFKVRHFFNKVPGSFSKFDGEIHLDRSDLTRSKAIATIHTDSVDTGNDSRDDHLRQPDYFNVEEHPTMTFTSTSWKKVKEKENTYEVTGDLELLGQKHPVTLVAVFLGEGEGRGGAHLIGWQASGTLDRTKWGLESGQPVVGPEVDLEINVQAARQNKEG